MADVVYDPEFYSFSFSWSNASGSIWCSPIQRRWQTLVLIVFDTAAGSLPQSIEDKAKRESCTHSQRYHSSRDRLVVVLISWLRACVCVLHYIYIYIYVCSVDWICLQSDEHTREKGKKREERKKKDEYKRRKKTYHPLVSIRHTSSCKICIDLRSVLSRGRYQIVILINDLDFVITTTIWWCWWWTHTYTCREAWEFALRDYES